MLPNILKTLQDSGDGMAVRTLSAKLRESPEAKSLSPEDFKSAFQHGMDEAIDLGFVSCRENHVKPMLNIFNAKESSNLRAQLMLLTEEMLQEQPPQQQDAEFGEPSEPADRSSRARSARPRSVGLEPNRGSSGQRRVTIPEGGSIMTAANKRSRSGSHSRGRRHTASSPSAAAAAGGRGRRRSRSRGAASPARRRSRSGSRRSRTSRSRSQRRR